jgi:hypothetical protein
MLFFTTYDTVHRDSFNGKLAIYSSIIYLD